MKESRKRKRDSNAAHRKVKKGRSQADKRQRAEINESKALPDDAEARTVERSSSELPHSTEAIEKGVRELASSRPEDKRELCGDIADYLTEAFLTDLSWPTLTEQDNDVESLVERARKQPEHLQRKPDDHHKLSAGTHADRSGEAERIAHGQHQEASEEEEDGPAPPVEDKDDEGSSGRREKEPEGSQPDKRRGDRRTRRADLKDGTEQIPPDAGEVKVPPRPLTRRNEAAARKRTDSPSQKRTQARRKKGAHLTTRTKDGEKGEKKNVLKTALNTSESRGRGRSSECAEHSITGEDSKHHAERNPTASRHPVEDIAEIEEVLVDGGSAKRRKQKKNRRKLSGKLEECVEEQILDQSGVTFADEESPNHDSGKTRIRSPWWRISGSDKTSTETTKTEKELIQIYVKAIIRSCIRESWSADSLKSCYHRDPSSTRGHAFHAVNSTLSQMERARHIGEIEARWRPELIRELLQRREIEWSTVEYDSAFDQFVGCDACLGHRQAAARLLLRGPRYDASKFWPGSSRFHVSSSVELEKRRLGLSVELCEGTINEHLVRTNRNNGECAEDDTEFWVDWHCLRKCLLFHELVHATAAIADALRGMIEEVVRHGVIEVKLSSKRSLEQGDGVKDALERSVVRSIIRNKEYIRARVAHLTDVIELGDLYFSSADAEVLDSGNEKPEATEEAPDIYDAPLELNDEQYRKRMEQITAAHRTCDR